MTDIYIAFRFSFRPKDILDYQFRLKHEIHIKKNNATLIMTLEHMQASCLKLNHYTKKHSLLSQFHFL